MPRDRITSLTLPVVREPACEYFDETSARPAVDTGDIANGAPCCSGRALESVRVLSRAPACAERCRYCRKRACHESRPHDDHICFPCEQQQLRQRRPYGYPWRPPIVRVCDSWCHKCSIQRCGLHDEHDFHLCVRCEGHLEADPAPAGGGTDWTGNDKEKTGSTA